MPSSSRGLSRGFVVAAVRSPPFHGSGCFGAFLGNWFGGLGLFGYLCGVVLIFFAYEAFLFSYTWCSFHLFLGFRSGQCMVRRP